MRTDDEENGGQLSGCPVAKIEWADSASSDPNYVSFHAKDFLVLSTAICRLRGIMDETAGAPGVVSDDYLADLQQRCVKAAKIVGMY